MPEHGLQYVEYYVWDPITRRRRISLRHILRTDVTFCGLSVPPLTATHVSPREVAAQYSDMVCRRCTVGERKQRWQTANLSLVG